MIKRALVFIFFASCAFAQSPVPAGSVLEKIATGFKFTEGPVWTAANSLLFSDVKGGKIYQWSAADSIVSVYMNPSDSSNGLMFDRQGRLILTQMAKRRVSRRDPDGTIVPLVSTDRGRRFNSPNDIIVRSDGSIFFTDPDFNTPAGQKIELPYKGVYRISPAGALQLLDSVFDKPNGICFSPDEKKLYVNESPLGKIYVWDVVNDSTITGKKLLYTIPATGYADGMKTDGSGNIYCAGPGGIWIVAPDGTGLGKIATPETPTNCAWGGKDGKTLFITAGVSLYRIRMSTTGVDDKIGMAPRSFKMYPNYPNPFNPSTTIQYDLPVDGFVSVRVFNTLGQHISTLVNELQHAGSHAVVFSPLHACSGIYICRIKAGSSTDAQKMFFTK